MELIMKTTKMMKLIHPQLGVCAQEIVTTSEIQVKKKWKSRYGRKFFECRITIETDEPSPRRIVNIKTGDIYSCVYEAAEQLDISVTKVRNHLNKRLSEKSYDKYLVRWE